MKKSKRIVLEILKSEMPYLQQEFKVKTLAIFGSYARDKANSNSDLDVMVEFDEPIGLKLVKLVLHIEKKTGLKIDLVSKEALRENFLDYIKEDLIYAN